MILSAAAHPAHAADDVAADKRQGWIKFIDHFGNQLQRPGIVVLEQDLEAVAHELQAIHEDVLTLHGGAPFSAWMAGC